MNNFGMLWGMEAVLSCLVLGPGVSGPEYKSYEGSLIKEVVGTRVY